MKIPGVPFFLLFCGVGLVCLVLGIINYVKEEQFFATAEHDTATLVEYRPDRDPQVADFCPQFEFTTQAGQTISYEGEKCLSEPDPSTIGQHEEVYIDPKNPQSVESRGWTGSEGSGLILGAIGCLFFPLIGAISVIGPLLQKRRKSSFPNRI